MKYNKSNSCFLYFKDLPIKNSFFFYDESKSNLTINTTPINFQISNNCFLIIVRKLTCYLSKAS